MCVASRDARMREIAAMTEEHTNAISYLFADMKIRARNNHYLQQVVEDYQSRVRETITSLEQEKEALAGVVMFLGEIGTTDEPTSSYMRTETNRILLEIKSLDREISRLKRSFI
jgi:hypothetical protein